jgi:predicted MPP superfamily phosphohydrolase
VHARFWIAALGFHVALGAVCLWIARRWPALLERFAAGRDDGIAAWLRAFLRDAVTLGASALLLAAAASLIAPRSGFTIVRFLSQALFGEVILLAVWLAVLHRRHSFGRRGLLPAALAIALLAVYWDAYHIEPEDLRVSAHTVDLASATGSPQRLRIVHLSDIQTDRVGEHEDRAIREALALSPDLIVLTGDYIQPRLRPTRAKAGADLKALMRARGFRAPLGVYAVCGDVDRDWPRVLEGTGITLLWARAARIPLGGRTLSVIGLSPGMSRGRNVDRMLRLIDSVPQTDLRLVIGHNPSFVREVAGRARVDLALAGHTHGGQVVLPFLGPPITKTALPARYAAGLNDYRGIPLHVTRGVGMERGTAPQIRFLCPPEICVIDVTYAGLAAPDAVARAR